eukprot:gene4482-5075_t
MEELKAFLENVQLEQYMKNLVENGYDDVKFMLTMEENEVKEMLAEANIEKKGHIKKFIAALKIRKCINIKQIASQDHSTAPPSVEIPAIVKEMLLPNTVKKKQEYFNYSTNQLHEDCYSLMEQIKTSADGNCLNIQKFSAEDCQINPKTMYRAKNALEFVENNISQVRNFEEKINNCSVQLYNTQHEVVSWKHNELEFYTEVLQTVKKVKEEFFQWAGNINAAIARSSGISMSSAEQHQKRRAEKRKQENKAKSEK